MLLAMLVVAGCSGRLDHTQAEQIIEQSPLVKPDSDNVKVDAISSTSQTEAVVRATIADNTLNLKFRRFDNGWTWEFVETKSGGWIAPDVAMGQIRETQRAVAAAAWAEQHASDYALSARTVWLVSVHAVENPKLLVADPALKKRLKDGLIAMWGEREDPEAKTRLAILNNERVLDAWGSEILVNFDPKGNGEWLIVSPGADRRVGTADDLVCLSTHTEGYEYGREVWNQHRRWTAPEGLRNVVEPLADERADKIEIRQLPNPS